MIDVFSNNFFDEINMTIILKNMNEDLTKSNYKSIVFLNFALLLTTIN
jgi:hypothetical protein